MDEKRSSLMAQIEMGGSGKGTAWTQVKLPWLGHSDVSSLATRTWESTETASHESSEKVSPVGRDRDVDAVWRGASGGSEQQLEEPVEFQLWHQTASQAWADGFDLTKPYSLASHSPAHMRTRRAESSKTMAMRDNTGSSEVTAGT